MRYVCKSDEIEMVTNARSLIEAIYKLFSNAKVLTGSIFETYAEMKINEMNFIIKEEAK